MRRILVLVVSVVVLGGCAAAAVGGATKAGLSVAQERGIKGAVTDAKRE